MKSRFNALSIPVKVSLLVLLTVFISVAAFASFIYFKVRIEQEKSFAQTVQELGHAMGEQIWHNQEDSKRDMTNILALIDPQNPSRGLEAIRIILQKNPELL